MIVVYDETVPCKPIENNILLDIFREKLVHRQPINTFPVKRSDVRDAAVLMALTRATKPEVVFIKRADHLSMHRGQVGFPGGMWEPDDKNLIDTALRESEEEIALPRDQVEVVAKLETEISLYAVRITPFLGFIPEGLAFEPELSELESVFQVPLDHLLTASNHTESTFSTNVGVYNAPCIYYQDYCIWGITYRIMLNVFKEVFGFDPGGDREPTEIIGAQ